MRFLQDMSYADIAARLGLTHCKLRKRIQLAYRALREVLGDLRPVSPENTDNHNEQAGAS